MSPTTPLLLLSLLVWFAVVVVLFCFILFLFCFVAVVFLKSTGHLQIKSLILYFYFDLLHMWDKICFDKAIVIFSRA